jgi:hypothetical protein
VRARRSLTAAAALVLLPACGLLFAREVGEEFPPPMTGEPPAPEPPNSFFVEGLVLDGATLAPVAGADVVVTTERPGYVLAARTGASGRFELTISNLVRRNSALDMLVEQIFLPGEAEATQTTDHFTLGARARERCAPARWYPMDVRRVVLWLEPCRTP